MIHSSSAPSSRRRSNSAWRARTSLASPSLLLLAEAASHGASAFLVPVITTPRTAIYSRATSLCQTSATEADGGEDKSPAGLTLEGVYKRLKLDSIGVDDGGVSLDSTDPDYGVEIVKINVPREPSLGMALEEVARGGDGRGLVLVSGTQPGGNAEATGNIFVGDTLCWVGIEPDRMKKVEALDWDQTVSTLGDFADESEITLVSKRLVKRETIKVEFELPSGTRDIEIKTGSNLRGEMMRLEVPVYDPQTKRFDQPYATGNCGGEGTCGTCFVEVQQGDEFLSPPDQEEQMLLSRGNIPVRWRLSCKTIVGKENAAGVVRVKAVPQAQWRAQRK